MKPLSGIRNCLICGGTGRARYHDQRTGEECERRCPCCRGLGQVSFEARRNDRAYAPHATSGRHAATWGIAISARSYAEYVRTCREKGLVPVYRTLYQTWRRRARMRGLMP